ncbi:tkl tkl-ccin protein kinase [Moniliophthora roreri MCA 2997]|uniref:Tkl tkl-ccin protein kinase n=1 Tax=Moniliophthora roreri (strain MCA 2997) TaxID=1381753 RepID=V2WKL6_MONRO|nr:tkl tkl-ccin protein kinase [Moniliophthora roreri MCA 2997]
MRQNSLLSAAELAASLSGIPFLGAACTLLVEIVECCNAVVVHKRKAKGLGQRCTQFLSALSDQASKLEGSPLQEHVDEVTAVLERINGRVRTWSRYGKVMGFVKSNDIERGLGQCEEDLNMAFKLFELNAHIVANHSQLETQQMLRSDQAELKDLLHQILTSHAEIRQIVALQSAGENPAEPIMAAGQHELRTLRETLQVERTTVDITSGPEYDTPALSHNVPSPRDGQRYLAYQRGLINLHRATGIPPSVKILDGEVTKDGDLPIAGGPYSDIWMGKWFDEEKVALKSLRNIKASDPKAQKKFIQELNLWTTFNHENILPFHGIATDLGPSINMVSPWQEHGNALDYVKAHPGADKIQLISGAANGLAYLHDRNIVHGDVKCANILVNSMGRACICDFGMSKVIEEVTERSASQTLTTAGSVRWLAPELIEGTMSSPSKACDVYSFAMTILELFTGKHPWADLRRDASVIHNVVILKRTPERPMEVPDRLWEMMVECWQGDALSRPQMPEIAERINIA